MKSVKAKPAARPSVHLSIDVPELEAGLRFYGQVFGFVETARPFPTMAIRRPEVTPAFAANVARRVEQAEASRGLTSVR